VGAGRSDEGLQAAQEILDQPEVPATVRGVALLAEGLAHLELKRAREAESSLAESRKLVPRRLQGLSELYELLARALRGVGGALEALRGIADADGTEPAKQAHARYALARAAVEQGDGAAAVDALSRAELLARQHARELLPALSRLKQRL